jgi:glycosyltransferase involved in cell wall biosynthesis
VPALGSPRTQGAPLVSIVTPCLNPGPRLERCLQSVARQSYPFVEHIVVDGGSTDGTPDFLACARDISWISESDNGQSQAINKGLRIASGNILTWLNADDVLFPCAVELAVDALTNLGKDGIAYGDCHVVSGGRRMTLWKPAARLSSARLDAGEIPPQPGTFVSARALEQVGLLDESLHLAMDVDLWAKLLAAGIPAVYVRYTMSEFELHPESKSGSVPWLRFYEEAAHALHRADRRDGAAFWLGRGIAVDAFDGRRIDVVRMGRALSDAAERSEGFRLVHLRAGARAEAATLELPKSLLGLRHLAVLDVWRSSLARQRLWSGFRRATDQLTHARVRAARERWLRPN